MLTGFAGRDRDGRTRKITIPFLTRLRQVVVTEAIISDLQINYLQHNFATGMSTLALLMGFYCLAQRQYFVNDRFHLPVINQLCHFR